MHGEAVGDEVNGEWLGEVEDLLMAEAGERFEVIPVR